jgi:acyl-CoA reductase-like NAD-dependent aldehyde dehydrogenase
LQLSPANDAAGKLQESFVDESQSRQGRQFDGAGNEGQWLGFGEAEPTLLEAMNQMRVAQEDIFDPVLI